MTRGADNRNPSLFQPLMIGLFCLVLALLFAATALMDVRRTQDTLLEIFENKAVTIIEMVETIAQDKLKGFMGITNRDATPFQDLQNMDEGFRMQEAVLTWLVELAREVDRKGADGSIGKEALEALRKGAGLLAVGLYDAHGETVLEGPPVEKAARPRLKRLLEKDGEIVLDLNGDGGTEGAAYLLGVRRRNKEGMIVLMFGGKTLQSWALKAAIQAAVEEGGWRKGVRYVVIVDKGGRFLAGAGDLAEADTATREESRPEPAAGGEGVSGRRIIEGSPELLEVGVPVKIDGRRVGMARVGMEIDEVGRIRERNRAHIFFSTGLMMMGAFLAVFFFYRLQGRHQRNMQEMQRKLIRAERLSSLGRLAAGVAHEIRNPLNAVSMAIQRLYREFAPAEPGNKEEFSHIVSVVREEIRRLDRIIEDFVGPVRSKRTELRPEQLADVVHRVVRLAREEIGQREIRIESQGEDPDLVIHMDPARMHQALFNLIKNAMESISGRGTVTVAAEPRGSDHAVLIIRDTGVGIPPGDIRRIMEFEYTTKEKGLGLGLPMAREIIQAHGGEITIDSDPGKGTTVEVLLPRGKS